MRYDFRWLLGSVSVRRLFVATTGSVVDLDGIDKRGRLSLRVKLRHYQFFLI